MPVERLLHHKLSVDCGKLVMSFLVRPYTSTFEMAIQKTIAESYFELYPKEIELHAGAIAVFAEERLVGYFESEYHVTCQVKNYKVYYAKPISIAANCRMQ